MNGPQHYTAAERLIDRHDRALGAGDYDYEAGADDLAAAQVHATLALAAAAAYQARRDYYGDALRDGSEWEQVSA